MRLVARFASVSLAGFALAGTVVVSSAAYAMPFGNPGRDGRSGADGRHGRNGQSISIKALGDAASYNLSGSQGSDGYAAEHGGNAYNCNQTQPAANLTGARGGHGGNGGSGGNGGNGGDLTVYYTDITALQSIQVDSIPGAGGRGGQSAMGGTGCRCQVPQWTIGDQHYRCSNGAYGNNGRRGNFGSRGNYGSVMIIGQLEPLQPERPKAQVEMTQMQTAPIHLSQNHWERRQGASLLFQAGSNIADNYLMFIDRTDIDLSFSWQASRPLTDFEGWTMLAQIEGNEAKLYLPDNLWVDGEMMRDGNQQTYVFRGAVKTGELGNLQFESFSGSGLDHTVSVKDHAGVSNVLNTVVHVDYYTWENGQYQRRFNNIAPTDAILTSAGGFSIAMGKLGIDEKYLKLGTQAYIGLTLDRKLGTHSASYTMGSYYNIKLSVRVGDQVRAARDANLYIGSSVVGRVVKGDVFTVSDISGDWIALKKLDGTAVRGWIALIDLESVPAP